MFEQDEIDDQEENLEEVSEEPEVDEISEAEDDDDEAELEVSDSDDEESDEEDDEDAGDDEADGLVVDLGGDDDDEAEEKDTGPMRSLRQANRELKKRLKELEGKGQESPTAAAQELGPKPTLADFNYDDEKHEAALVAWHDQKRELEAKQAEAEQEAQKAQEAYQSRFDGYQAAKAELGVNDFDEAEDAARETLTQNQQSVIIAHAKQPELVIYALGKNTKQAAELAAEKDPIAFAVKVTRLEENMKVTGTKKPKPEKKQSRGGAPRNAAPQIGSKKLDAAFKEAQKTGDFSNYQALKRAQKAQG